MSVFADTPVLCGDRASGRGELENTHESYRAAVACGLGWVEVDARITADDVLVAVRPRERTTTAPVAAAAHLGVAVVAANVESFIERDTAASVRVAHQAGLQVAAWCPEPVVQDALIEAGVDCLVIDDVPAATARQPSA